MGEMNIQKVMAAILESLTDAQKEQVKACKDTNELIAKLSEMGVALPDELLDAAVGAQTRYAVLWKAGYGGQPHANAVEIPSHTSITTTFV